MSWTPAHQNTGALDAFPGAPAMRNAAGMPASDVAGWGEDAAAGPAPPRRLFLARVAFMLFCVGVVLRVLAGDVVLNLLYPYTAEGGNLAGKIHPSNYLFLFGAGLLYAGPGFRIP